MENFEFLRSMNIGQYLPLDSPIHRLDPRARLVAGAMLLGAVTFASRPVGLALGLAVFLAALGLARVPIRFALRGLLPPLPFLLVLALLQVFINPYPETTPIYFHIGSLAISGVDLWAGLALLMRFAGLILGLSLVSFCLSTSEMIYGLSALLRPLARAGLPVHDLVMMVQVTLRFLPLLAQSMERIAKAQASRGADWGTGRGGLLNVCAGSSPCWSRCSWSACDGRSKWRWRWTPAVMGAPTGLRSSRRKSIGGMALLW